MSKQEIYAWCSLASSLALLGYYLIAVFGWPEGLEAHADYVTRIFWRVLGITIVVELVLELSTYFKWGQVEKDERDILIESKGYRNAYYFVMVAIVSLVINVLVSDLIGESTGQRVLLAIPFMTFHALVAILFITNITKSTTQLFYYLKN